MRADSSYTSYQRQLPVFYRSRGASMIEFLLVFGVIFSLCYFLVQLADNSTRLSASQHLAREVLRASQTDPRLVQNVFSANSAPGAGFDATTYLQARQNAVVTAAKSVQEFQSIVGNDKLGEAPRKFWRVAEYGSQSGPNPVAGVNEFLAYLPPGTSAKFVDTDGAERWVHHSKCCDPDAPGCTSKRTDAGNPCVGQTASQLMQRFPTEVVGIYKGQLLFSSKTPMTFMAVGYPRIRTTSPPPSPGGCGNGVQDPGEECDFINGSQVIFGGPSCSGPPFCQPVGSTSQCKVSCCGDGFIDQSAGETCDIAGPIYLGSDPCPVNRRTCSAPTCRAGCIDPAQCVGDISCVEATEPAMAGLGECQYGCIFLSDPTPNGEIVGQCYKEVVSNFPNTKACGAEPNGQHASCMMRGSCQAGSCTGPVPDPSKDTGPCPNPSPFSVECQNPNTCLNGVCGLHPGPRNRPDGTSCVYPTNADANPCAAPGCLSGFCNADVVPVPNPATVRCGPDQQLMCATIKPHCGPTMNCITTGAEVTEYVPNGGTHPLCLDTTPTDCYAPCCDGSGGCVQQCIPTCSCMPGVICVTPIDPIPGANPACVQNSCDNAGVCRQTARTGLEIPPPTTLECKETKRVCDSTGKIVDGATTNIRQGLSCTTASPGICQKGACNNGNCEAVGDPLKAGVTCASDTPVAGNPCQVLEYKCSAAGVCPAIGSGTPKNLPNGVACTPITDTGALPETGACFPPAECSSGKCVQGGAVTCPQPQNACRESVCSSANPGTCVEQNSAAFELPAMTYVGSNGTPYPNISSPRYSFTISAERDLGMRIHVQRTTDDAALNYPAVTVMIERKGVGGAIYTSNVAESGAGGGSGLPNITGSGGTSVVRDDAGSTQEDVFYNWFIPKLPPGDYELTMGMTYKNSGSPEASISTSKTSSVCATLPPPPIVLTCSSLPLTLSPNQAYNQSFVQGGFFITNPKPVPAGSWNFRIAGSPINYSQRPVAQVSVEGTFTASDGSVTCSTTITPQACLDKPSGCCWTDYDGHYVECAANGIHKTEDIENPTKCLNKTKTERLTCLRQLLGWEVCSALTIDNDLTWIDVTETCRNVGGMANSHVSFTCDEFPISNDPACNSQTPPPGNTDPCGNGVLDPGEACDPAISSNPLPNGCEPANNFTCSPSCQWQPDPLACPYGCPNQPRCWYHSRGLNADGISGYDIFAFQNSWDDPCCCPRAGVSPPAPILTPCEGAGDLQGSHPSFEGSASIPQSLLPDGGVLYPDTTPVGDYKQKYVPFNITSACPYGGVFTCDVWTPSGGALVCEGSKATLVCGCVK